MTLSTKFDAIVLAHLYNLDVSVDLLGKLKVLQKHNTCFLFNIQGNAPHRREIAKHVSDYFPSAIVISSPAIGRDIGGKLNLIQLMMELRIRSQIALVVHDKKSPHTSDGKTWRDRLFKVFDASNIDKVFQLFNKDRSIGLVGASELIVNEYIPETNMFMCTSSSQIRQLLSLLKMKVTDHNYVAGSVFWIRSEILNGFFENREISKLRDMLESGNKLDVENGTIVHAWERILSWTSNSMGYKIYGI